MQGSLKVVKNSRGEKVWRLQWRENGKGRTRLLGNVREVGRAEAESLRNAIVGPLAAHGAEKRPTGVTLAGYIQNDYLPSCSARWKRSTETTTTSLIELHILPALGSRLIAGISRRDLQEHLGNLAASGLSKGVVNHVRFQLRAIFRMAVGDRRVMGNPTEGIVTPRMRPAKAPRLGEEALISKALMMLPTRERLFLALAVRRGLRPGEIVGLRVGDIQDGFLRVERRVYRGVVDTPKTELGNRRVPIESLNSLIDQHLATLEETGPKAWLFPSERTSTPINANAMYRKRLAPTLRAVGLAGFNFQAMRRTFATLYAQSETDAKLRASVMGHGVKVQESVYRQTTDKQKALSIRRFEEPIQ